MMTLQPSIKIYLCLQPADMRKQMDGLSILAQEQICESPMSGHLFLFHNRGRNRLKILYWDTNGYVGKRSRLTIRSWHGGGSGGKGFWSLMKFSM